MANYSKFTWVNKSAGGFNPASDPALDAGNLNTLDLAVQDANDMSTLQGITPTGTADSWIVTLTGIRSYFVNLSLMVQADLSNTGTVTINVNGLGSKNLKINGVNTDLGDIKAGVLYMVKYNGTSFDILDFSASLNYAPSGVRQVVQSSSVDATSGLPDYISIGTGLAVDIAATTTDVTFHVSSAKTKEDRIGVIKTDTTISGLTDSTTNYLFAEVADDGTVTLGFSVVKPVYQFGGAFSTTLDQHTFNISEMTMKRGTGGGTQRKFRVFIGEAVTVLGVVDSVVNYALNGIHQELDVTIAATTALTVPHALGVDFYDVKLTMINTITELGYSVGDRILHDGSGSNSIQAVVLTQKDLIISYATTSPMLIQPQGGGNPTAATFADWSLEIFISRGW